MSDEHTELSALKHHLNTLTSLSEKLEQVRSSPAILLESGLPPDNSLPGLTASLFQTTSPKRSGDISATFQHLAQLSQQLQQPGSEAALQSAASLSDGTNAPTVTDVQKWWAERCELRKSQSTDPGILNFEEPPPSRPVFVPPLQPNAAPLSNSKLQLFIKSFNKARSNRRMSVRICCHDKPPATLKDPITIRMILEDVLIAYITLGFDDLIQGQSSPLSVEFISVFGSRETKPLHTSSDYAVFRQLTQYLTGIIRDQPDISFQSILRILESYRDLFYARCISCDRVASVAGNLPPIARLWTKFETPAPVYDPTIGGVQHGDLIPWHLDCLEA